ncbi:hypothetical protein [Halobellus captivus]|uniref:hypothetical protein n=1 Tax=Halobellus captivus TaxID=2592614 RepID=UPI0011A823D9|nr:hypothetical protein [Halobellus captivus]
MREDELATAAVEHFEAAFESPEIHLEEPYDHYGNRGAVDLYVRTRPPERVEYVVELKADPAVRMAGGANEILRQYRRMERYFYEDDEHALRKRLGREAPAINLLLLFAPTTRCVEHVYEYRRLYGSIDADLTIDGVAAARKVAFLVNLDEAASGGLGFLSVNGEVTIGTVRFAEAVPDGSRLAEALDAAEIPDPGERPDPG